MKILFVDNSSQEIKLQDVHPDRHYIGFKKRQSPTEKGFITREQWRKGIYRAYSFRGMTYGNGWDGHESEDLHKMLQSMNGSFEIEVFYTAEEMFKWLIG